ncbi:MAG: 16S rRNA (cytosine(1402)-N(4))-methyltransferase RsmH, partial [Oscillospiraceae bacterium]|nr:16S rRNA (cytosine(1402)-N(4))-methyltransferase RsmH [Oscillospiraceae bacterium]
ARRLTTGRLLALDKDPDALKIASQRLAPYPAASVHQTDFADLASVLDREGIEQVDGILLDLGVSSHQLDTPERGFSYSADAPLDMRMSQSGLSAADVVNTWAPEDLLRILREYGEERFASRIVHNIVEAREKAPLTSTSQLVDIIYASIPAKARAEGGHPAKRTFQAIRIAVNGELDSLTRCLNTAFERLAPGGRFVIITFHSLEDRIVKQSFAGYCKGCTCPPDFPVCVCGNKPKAKLINRKPIVASAEELEHNRRSKSAKLRIIEKL